MRIDRAYKAKLFRLRSAKITDEPSDASPDSVVVQFNPTSLAYSAQNTLEKKGRDASAKQFVAQTTAKLEFDLIFDTTHDGSDVRRETDKIKRFLDPGTTAKEPAPPVVGFRWATFKFKGVVESFRETLDFFSAEGVPLRSAVKVSLSSQDPKDVFAAQTFGETPGKGGADAKLITVPPRGTSDMTRDGGRVVAAANGFESMRNAGGGLAAVASGGVELKAAAGFSVGASAGIGGGVGVGAGTGIGASAGFGVGAGIGGGASAGFGLGAGIGGGASAGFGLSAGIGGGAGAGFGASAGAGASLGFGASVGAGSSAGFAFASASSSRGVSASMGAFAGLGPSKTPSVARVDLQLLAPAPVVGSVSAGFALGGKAIGEASAGLKADVGVGARIKFD